MEGGRGWGGEGVEEGRGGGREVVVKVVVKVVRGSEMAEGGISYVVFTIKITQTLEYFVA